jgi:hypothetical protein
MMWTDFVAANQSYAVVLAPLAGIIIFLALAELVLKGFALYKSAKLEEKGWFIAILLFNTLGILPAIYLYIRRKK